MIKNLSDTLHEKLEQEKMLAQNEAKNVLDIIPQSDDIALIYNDETCQAQLVFAAFNTVITIIIYASEESAQFVSIKAINQCRYYERLFSRTLEHSEVSKINRSKGEKLTLSKDTFNLLEAALYYCRESHGYFDISIGSVSRLWDFTKEIVPDKEKLSQALRFVDFRQIELDKKDLSVRVKKPGVQIDLGGIAKGYIADKLDEMFLELGFSSYLINLGGNIFARGLKPDDSPWLIGLMNPKEPGKNLSAFSLHDASSVSSGTYERAFTQDGFHYHHILDPKTGFPVQTDLLEASLVCKKSIDAEGYSTTMLALGLDRALEFAQAKDEIVQCYLVDLENRVYSAK